MGKGFFEDPLGNVDGDGSVFDGGGVGTILGGVGGFMLGGPAGAALGMSVGGSLFGGGGLFSQPQTPKGGGDSGAYMAQIQAALAQADAAKYTADQQMKLGQSQIDAQLQIANQSMMGGIIGAAMASQKSNVIRKEMLPHEEGAAQIASMDMAQKWDKTLSMRIAGYDDVAINHELQGKSWKPLFRDAEWNAMNMMKQTRQDVLQNSQLFGFKSSTNPMGIDMPIEDYMRMMSMKDPNELLKVDPNVAAQRNAQYDSWKQQMYASGNDLIVQMFENPQLSGGSIMSMKGKEALIDPRLAPLLQQMNTGDNQTDLHTQLMEYDAATKPKSRTTSGGKTVYTDGSGKLFGNQGGQDAKGKGITLAPDFAYNDAMEAWQAGRGKIINEYYRKHDMAQENKIKWDDAINALTKGEQNQYTDQINKLIEAGVIERETGRVNGAALAKMVPPELLQSPEFSMFRELDDNEKAALTDEYNRLAEMKVDPKLVRTEAMGGGVTRKVLLNPDGTRAATMMEGYMMDATGQQHFVSMAGNRTQDFYDRASQIAGYSPLSPGYRAPMSQDQMAGKLEMRSDDNYLAQYNGGQKTQKASTSQKAQSSMPKAPTNAPKLSMPSNPAASAGGAPLAAGDD